MDRVPVAVALGSNLGARAQHLEFARARLDEILANFRASTVWETAPAGTPFPQPEFLNQVVVGESSRSPRELLESLLAIERERGRTRPFAGAPRTLDLDLILVGDRIVTEPDLVLPHPRFRERRFVLEPLAEIAPEMVDPVTRQTIRELVEQLGSEPIGSRF
jgi:2-amino-4-hydroxy-6-hydroxymethyldihydropteridine diphosphokinase